MQQIEPKQKKIALIVVAALVFIHFAPSYIGMLLYKFGHRNQVATVQPKPVTPPPTVSLPTPQVDPIAAQFLGTFRGTQTLMDGMLTNCVVQLEVKPAINRTGFFSAYETKSCRPSPFSFHGALTAERMKQTQKLMLDASPIETSMSGSIVDSSMTFRIDQVVGASPGHCGPSEYSVSSFGANQILARWKQSDPCPGPGGNMVLIRSRG